MPRKKTIETPQVDEQEVYELELLYAAHQRLYKYMEIVSDRLCQKYRFNEILNFNDKFYARSPHVKTHDILEELHDLLRMTKKIKSTPKQEKTP